MEYRDFSLKIHESASAADSVIKAQLELTYGCNLHCLHCYTDPYNKPEHLRKELSTPEIKRILDEMAEMGILWLNLTGGEVFMHEDFFEIYEYAHRKGFILTLFTNGTMFTPKIIERLQQNPPFFIDISCHSVNEEAFDWFTQVKGSFKNFIAGMQQLKRSGLPFRMKTKAMNWNKKEIADVRRFIESFGLEFSFTTALGPRLDGSLSSLDYRLSVNEIADLETREGIYLEDEASCKNHRSRVAPPETDKLYRCSCATDSIHVSAFGELGTCSFQYEVRESLRKYPLKEAVERVFSKVRSLVYKTDSACKSCEIYSFCDQSPTEFRRQTGDAEKPIAYYCDLAQNKAERLTKTKVKHPLETSLF